MSGWSHSHEPRRVTYSEAAVTLHRATELAARTMQFRDNVVKKLGESTMNHEIGSGVGITWAVYRVSSDRLDRENREEDRQVLLAHMAPFANAGPDAWPSLRIGSVSTIETDTQESLLVENVLIDPSGESSHRIDAVSLDVDEDDAEGLLFWLEDNKLQTTEPLRDPSPPDWFSRKTQLLGRSIMPVVSFYEPGVQLDIEGALTAGISMLEDIAGEYPLASGYLRD